MRWRQPEGAVRRQQLFLLDCSASMVESGAFAQAKGLLLRLDGAPDLLEGFLVEFGHVTPPFRCDLAAGPAPPARRAC